jgi:ParB family chromosome partitioning protein
MAKLSVNKNPNKLELTGGRPRAELIQQIKELKNKQVKKVSPDSVKTADPFRELFPVKPETLKAVTESIKDRGYDPTQPVIIWQEKNILIDGHTRLQAAKEAGLSEIPAVMVSLETEQDAVNYAYTLQFNRRNLDDADRFTFLERLIQGDSKYFSATLHKNNSPGRGRPQEGINKGIIAEILPISPRTAQKYINILNAQEEIKTQVRSGDLSINQADKLLKPDQPKTPQQKPGEPDPETIWIAPRTPGDQEENPESGEYQPQKAAPDIEGYISTKTPEKTPSRANMKGVLREKEGICSIITRLLEKYPENPDDPRITGKREGIREFITELYRAGLIPTPEYNRAIKQIGE